MHNIIKNGAVSSDNWQIITATDITDSNTLPSGDLVLPLAVWLQLRTELSTRTLGVWLESSALIENLDDATLAAIKALPLIAIQFPLFSDGRGYSTAHILRKQIGYKGELRAMGDVLRDQLFFMQRVGFNSFSMRADQNLSEAVAHFNDFSNPYQAAVDQHPPLFQQR